MDGCSILTPNRAAEVDLSRARRQHVSAMNPAQQFVCKKCNGLANVQTYEQTLDGVIYCRCEYCGAKNQVVWIALSASQPGLLPVKRLLR